MYMVYLARQLCSEDATSMDHTCIYLSFQLVYVTVNEYLPAEARRCNVEAVEYTGVQFAHP